MRDRQVRRIVSRPQLAVQQGVDPDIGAPRPACGLCTRRGTRRRPGRCSLRGSRLHRLLRRPGLHDVAIDPSGGRLLSHHDAESLLRRGTRRRPERGGLHRLLAARRLHDVGIQPPNAGAPRHRDIGPVLRLGAGRRPGHGGMPGSHLQRLLTRPGLHNVAIEPPGVRMLSHRNVEQWHRPSTLLGTGPARRRSRHLDRAANAYRDHRRGRQTLTYRYGHVPPGSNDRGGGYSVGSRQLHHYVAQMNLGRFSVEPDRENPPLWTMESGSGRIRKAQARRPVTSRAMMVFMISDVPP
jgi:hypothetical protein